MKTEITVRQSRILNDLLAAGPDGMHTACFTYAEKITLRKLEAAGLVYFAGAFCSLTIEGLEEAV